MHRSNLLLLLEQYQPQSFEQEVVKQRVIHFVRTHSDCFERSLQIGHITASAFLLNNGGTHVLLMHHAKLDKWMQLGGHCDGVSDVVAVAIKEAQEESGMADIVPVSQKIFDIDIHRIPARPGEPEHDHYDIRFLLRVASNEAVRKNNESKELRWVARDLSNLPPIEESVMRMVRAWQRLF